jgi:CoA:oxalate CoA-transferase
MNLPLEGVRVLDMTIWQQGPVATQMLADMGAEVITIDLTKDKGKEVIYRLVEESDVFVQNFRPGIMKRLRLDYKTISQINPRIIYASGTGWGSRGPDAKKPAFDVLAQGRGGMLSVSGEPDEPPPLIQVNGAADWVGASLLAYGIMVALFNRERHGIGQEVEVSLLGSQAFMGQLGFQRYLFSGKAPRRVSRKAVGNPFWNTYQAGDGKWFILAALQSQRFWPFLCKALGISELENDSRFNSIESRRENSAELVEILDRVFATGPRVEWINRLEEVGVPCAPVNDYADLASDTQMTANDYIVDFDHPTAGPVKLVGIPVRLSETPGKLRIGAPEFGQHTEEVLLEVAGFSWEEIAELKSQEVI